MPLARTPALSLKSPSNDAPSPPWPLCAGDRGFDPLGLGKPTEYLQVDIDELDQNAPKNKAGGIIGSFQQKSDKVSATDRLAPYDEVRCPSLS